MYNLAAASIVWSVLLICSAPLVSCNSTASHAPVATSSCSSSMVCAGNPQVFHVSSLSVEPVSISLLPFVPGGVAVDVDVGVAAAGAGAGAGARVVAAAAGAVCVGARAVAACAGVGVGNV